MKITINGAQIESSAATVAELLTEQNISSVGIAVAVGSKVIMRGQWGDTPISEGMVITVIRATQGG